MRTGKGLFCAVAALWLFGALSARAADGGLEKDYKRDGQYNQWSR